MGQRSEVLVRRCFLIKSKRQSESFFFFFTALISQVKSVTVHATDMLAWRREINKDKGEGRGCCRGRDRGGESGTTRASSHENSQVKTGRVLVGYYGNGCSGLEGKKGCRRIHY